MLFFLFDTRPAGASLEGFLFPDTYEVAQGISAHDLVQEQLDAFDTYVLTTRKKRTQKS